MWSSALISMVASSVLLSLVQATTVGDPDLSITDIEGPKGATAVIAEGAPWFLEKNHLSRFDLKSNTQTTPIDIEQLKRVGFAFGGSVIGGGSWWGYGKAHNAEGIHRIDLSTGKCIAAIPLKPRKGENLLSSGEGALWVFNLHDGNLKRVDPRTNQVSGEVEVGKGFWKPVPIADGFLWTMGVESGAVERIDPNSLKIVDTFAAGHPQKKAYSQNHSKALERSFLASATECSG